MPDTEFPQWLDNVDTNTIGVFTLDDGERLTADVLDFNDKRAELNVEVISSNRSSPHTRERRAISVDSVISFEPRPRAMQPWPYSDPCRSTSFSGPRFVLTTLFVSLMIGTLLLFVFLPNRPYRIQEVSAIAYTTLVAFLTFARTGTGPGKDRRPYSFTCPAVRPQFSRLLWRHVLFLAALFILQTLALALHSKLSDSWDTPDWRGRTPFETTLMLLCCVLAYAQVATNRSLLKRAHREFST
jgi:hypothetical protein